MPTARLGATITAHHLLYNRNAIFEGGIRPHYYCLPVLKRETHRVALVEAATSGSPRFFLGTDSAPHADGAEGACVRLRRLLHGAACASSSTPKPSTRPARSTSSKASPASTARTSTACRATRSTVTLQREEWTLPAELPDGDTTVVPLRGGESIGWRLA